MGFPIPLPVNCRDVRKRKWEPRPNADPFCAKHHVAGKAGRYEGMISSVEHKDGNKGEVVDIQHFYAHQLSRVDDRGTANLVPLFAAHHIECVQLGWAISHPFCLCQNKYFLRKFGDENTSRNITYRDQFSRVATSNTVVRL